MGAAGHLLFACKGLDVLEQVPANTGMTHGALHPWLLERQCGKSTGKAYYCENCLTGSVGPCCPWPCAHPPASSSRQPAPTRTCTDQTSPCNGSACEDTQARARLRRVARWTAPARQNCAQDASGRACRVWLTVRWQGGMRAALT